MRRRSRYQTRSSGFPLAATGVAISAIVGLALTFSSCSRAHATPSAVTVTQCERIGAALESMVTLRQAGWSQAEVDELHNSPQIMDLSEFVFQLNEQGLAKSAELAAAVEQICLINDSLQVRSDAD